MNVLVFGDEHPASPANFGQPFDVWRILGEMVDMYFDAGARRAERIGNNVRPIW